MTMNMAQGRNLGGPLEYTVSEVISQSVDALIDAGVRFTIINDSDKYEEDYVDDYRTSEC